MSQRERKGILQFSFSRYLFNIACAVLQSYVGNSRRGVLFQLLHSTYFIIHISFCLNMTLEQLDCEQVQNKLFLLIIPGFYSLFMVHWIHKNSVDDEKKDLPVI